MPFTIKAKPGYFAVKVGEESYTENPTTVDELTDQVKAFSDYLEIEEIKVEAPKPAVTKQPAAPKE